MKRKRPTPLICTARLIYEPRKGLVWDKRTYYDSRSICFGKLLSSEAYEACPPNLLDEWGEIVTWHIQNVLMKVIKRGA